MRYQYVQMFSFMGNSGLLELKSHFFDDFSDVATFSAISEYNVHHNKRNDGKTFQNKINQNYPLIRTV